MRDIFAGYYTPTKAQYDDLWQKGVIVLDTNLLLDLYRLPEAARDDLLSVLESVRDRLWIPHQVALEYQRNRLSVIADGRRSTEGALKVVRDLASGARQRVSELQMEKRGLGIETQPILTELDTASQKTIEAISKVQASQLDISANDPVRDRLDQLLEGRVGAAPSSQAELDALVSDGDQRFEQKIPPGFEDSAKDKNPEQATFLHDKIQYRRKYGDLILWRQLLSYAKEKKTKALMFVTSDRKEDWWQVVQGRAIGPLPELVREALGESGLELFWMYTSDQFVQHAKTYTKTKVADLTVEQIKSVSEENMRASVDVSDRYFEVVSESIASWRSQLTQEVRNHDQETIEASIRRWIERRHGSSAERYKDFPDFVVIDSGLIVGYEIRYLRAFEKMLFSPAVINAMLRGYLEVSERRIDKFEMVVAVSESTHNEIEATVGGVEQLRRRVTSLIDRYPIGGMTVGASIQGEFRELVSVP